MTDTTYPLQPTKLRVGQDVEDVLSGYKGRVTSIVHRLSGTIQAGVQPVAAEGAEKMPEVYYIDHEGLDVIGEGASGRATLPGDPLVKLGWKVRDRVTGFTGMVEQIIVCFNGCIMLLLTGPHNKEGKPTHHYIDHKMVVKVDAGVSEDAEVPVKRAATGCLTEPGVRF